MPKTESTASGEWKKPILLTTLLAALIGVFGWLANEYIAEYKKNIESNFEKTRLNIENIYDVCHPFSSPHSPVTE